MPKPPKIKRDGGLWPEDAILLAERLGPAVGVHVLTSSRGCGSARARLHRQHPADETPASAGEFVCPILRVTEEYAEATERDKDGRKTGTSSSWSRRRTTGRRGHRRAAVPRAVAAPHLADWPHERVFCTPSGRPWLRQLVADVPAGGDGRPEREKRQGVGYRAAWGPILPMRRCARCTTRCSRRSG